MRVRIRYVLRPVPPQWYRWIDEPWEWPRLRRRRRSGVFLYRMTAAERRGFVRLGRAIARPH